jgi:hypothetical protein
VLLEKQAVCVGTCIRGLLNASHNIVLNTLLLSQVTKFDTLAGLAVRYNVSVSVLLTKTHGRTFPSLEKSFLKLCALHAGL